MSEPAYHRILLKLSGEALMGESDFGIDPAILERLAGDVRQLTAAGVQLGIVIGGGNIFRGAGLVRSGIDRVTGGAYRGRLRLAAGTVILALLGTGALIVQV